MQHYPLFLNLKGKHVIFSGAGDHAAAKIRLLLKTEAQILVFGNAPCSHVLDWHEKGLLALHLRSVEWQDLCNAHLVYCANDEAEEDARIASLGRWAGALVNIVDNLQDSDFLTPAIVDRDPVIVAIGTEGTAPVLARQIKRDIEELLPTSTGKLAQLASRFRPIAARLPSSAVRRDFWHRFFFQDGPKAMADGGAQAVKSTLLKLFSAHFTAAPHKGHVDFIGAGPGDPDLLTLRARQKLHQADVVLYDRLVTPEILELARRESILLSVGKQGYGPSWKQADINALMIKYAQKGHRVARLKSGDPAIFGRLDEELDAIEQAGISFDIVPGITAASAAAAGLGTSLTKRTRNSSFRYLTARDVDGFAEQDWLSLAKVGSTAAIYMGVKAATYVSGRLLMHGADRATPVTVVENVSRINQKTVATTLDLLPQVIKDQAIAGPAIIFLGLSPRNFSEVSLADLPPMAEPFMGGA